MGVALKLILCNCSIFDRIYCYAFCRHEIANGVISSVIHLLIELLVKMASHNAVLKLKDILSYKNLVHAVAGAAVSVTVLDMSLITDTVFHFDFRFLSL